MLLRRFCMEDAQSLAKNANNPQIRENLRDGFPSPYNIDDARKFIASAIVSDESKQFLRAIVVDDVAIGSLGVFWGRNVHRRTAELGYWLGRDYWGKGLATAAVTEACDYLFENSDLLRIFAEPYEINLASCRVLEKIGF